MLYLQRQTNIKLYALSIGAIFNDLERSFSTILSDLQNF